MTEGIYRANKPDDIFLVVGRIEPICMYYRDKILIGGNWYAKNYNRGFGNGMGMHSIKDAEWLHMPPIMLRIRNIKWKKPL